MANTPTQHRTQTTETQEANHPVETLRDGWLKAAIWRNESERGAFFTTTVARTYRDEQGRLHDTQNFKGDDLLRLGELTRQAHHRTNELAREEYKSRQRAHQQDRSPSRDLTR